MTRVEPGWPFSIWLSLGHRIIAYANSRPDYLVGHGSLADRHQTYLREMKKLGLSIVPGHDEWLKSAEEFLTAAVIENGATAVLAYGYMEGLNLMQAAHRLGITVPRPIKCSLLL